MKCLLGSVVSATCNFKEGSGSKKVSVLSLDLSVKISTVLGFGSGDRIEVNKNKRKFYQIFISLRDES